MIAICRWLPELATEKKIRSLTDKRRHSDCFVLQVRGGAQFVEMSTQSGVVSKISGTSTRWEQGTCNKHFKIEAQKMGQKSSPLSNGKKVEFCTRIPYY